MSQWPSDWEEALTPSAEEVAAVVSPLSQETARAAAAATSPSASEIARLIARRPAVAPRAQRGLLLVALAAALLAGVLGWQRLAAPPWSSVPVGETVSLDGATLGPSIVVAGEADAVVLAAGAGGTAVEILSGELTFEVDPRGQYRDLLVRAGAVEVRVTGTRFSVGRFGDRVEVGVARGSVSVSAPTGALALGAGDRWSGSALAAVALEPAHALAHAALPEAPEAAGAEPPAEGGQEALERASAARPVEVVPEEIAAEAVAVPEPTGGSDEAVVLGELSEVAGGEATERDPAPADAMAVARAYAALQDALEAGAVEELLGEVDAFLARWPASPLAAEAELIRIELLRDGPEGPLLAAIDAWLAQHPEDDRCEGLRRERGSLTSDARGAPASEGQGELDEEL